MTELTLGWAPGGGRLSFGGHGSHDAAAEIKASWDAGNVAMASVILACVLAMYLYFSFWLG